MEEHRKQFFLTVLAVILGFYVTKLYDSLFQKFVPNASIDNLIISSTIGSIVVIIIIYILLYHDKKDFLNWK